MKFTLKNHVNLVRDGYTVREFRVTDGYIVDIHYRSPAGFLREEKNTGETGQDLIYLKRKGVDIEGPGLTEKKLKNALDWRNFVDTVRLISSD